MIIPLLTCLLAVSSVVGVAILGSHVYRFRDALQRIEALESRLEWIETGPRPGTSERPRTVAPKPPKTRRVDRKPVTRRTLIAVPDLTATPVSAPSDELVRRYGSIWDLAEGGASPESIARETGQPIGQVELILGLRNPRAASGAGVS